MNDAKRMRKGIVDVWRATPPLKLAPKPRGALVIDDFSLGAELRGFDEVASTSTDSSDALMHALKAATPPPESEPDIGLPEAFFVATETGVVRQYFSRSQLAIGIDAEIDPEDFGFVAIQPALTVERVISAHLDSLSQAVSDLSARLHRLEAEVIAPSRPAGPYHPVPVSPSVEPGWGKPYAPPVPYVGGGFPGIRFNGSEWSGETK